MDEGKVHPIAGNSGEKLGINAMPANVIQDGDGSPRVILMEATGTTAEVLLHGGQIISWKNERREEMLFLTNKALWKAGKAIRGGISICFPQSSNFWSPEQPGFVRNRLWSLDSSPSPLPPANPQSTVDLVLKSTDENLKTWPHRFELRLRISLSAGKLTLIPRVRNVDSKAFSFTFALCSYLSVSDISEVRVEGLETLDYFDNLLQKERYTEQADAITFDGEVERIYLSTPPKIAVIDHEKKRTFVLRKEGMPDAVLWNPWDKKAKALPDFGDEDYKAMLCLDSASFENPVSLKPCDEWKGRQELTAVSSSYCSGQLDPRKVLQGYTRRGKKDKRRRWICRFLKMKELPPLTAPSPPRDGRPQQLAEKNATSIRPEDPHIPGNGQSGDQHKESQESSKSLGHANILKLHQQKRGSEKSAAIKIQAAFRGYLARKALRALKGVVKLQALIRGWAVRQQTINTLKCLQSIVNIQSEVFSKRCNRVGELHNQDYKSKDFSEKDIKVDLNSQKRWDDSTLTKEELKALLFTRREASIKRERVREYYLNHRKSAETERDKVYGRQRYRLEQWVESQLAKSESPGNFDRTLSANSRNKDETGGRIRNFPKQYQADMSESPRRCYHHRKQRSIGDESSFAGSPSVPAYMASTESAKAKARSMSSPRLRPLSFDVCSEITSPYKYKLSPISSINSELTSSSWIGNHMGSKQRSPRLKGSPGPIKSTMSTKDLRLRGILYQNSTSVAPTDGL